MQRMPFVDLTGLLSFSQSNIIRATLLGPIATLFLSCRREFGHRRRRLRVEWAKVCKFSIDGRACCMWVTCDYAS